MERESGSVEVGLYLLRTGGEAGALLEKGGGDRSGEAKRLEEALEKPEAAAKAEDRAPAVVTEIDEAAEATTKIEQAAALCKGAAEGHALDPDQIALEVGTLLDCLERLDRGKKHKKAIQLARSLSTLLMLLKRWGNLVQTLRIALRAGKELGDEAAVAWAEHQLGTLRLAAGDVEGAERCLRRARDVRDRIGDRRGLAATNRNMQVLCDRLQAMLRDRHLVRPQGRGRTTVLRALSLAALFAALFGGGVAAGMIAGDSGQEPVAGERTPADPGGPSTGPTDRFTTDLPPTTIPETTTPPGTAIPQPTTPPETTPPPVTAIPGRPAAPAPPPSAAKPTPIVPPEPPPLPTVEEEEKKEGVYLR